MDHGYVPPGVVSLGTPRIQGLKLMIPESTPTLLPLSGNSDTSRFLDLPSELIDAIFSWLTPLELAIVSQVSSSPRVLCAIAEKAGANGGKTNNHTRSPGPGNMLGYHCLQEPPRGTGLKQPWRSISDIKYQNRV